MLNCNKGCAWAFVTVWRTFLVESSNNWESRTVTDAHTRTHAPGSLHSSTLRPFVSSNNWTWYTSSNMFFFITVFRLSYLPFSIVILGKVYFIYRRKTFPTFGNIQVITKSANVYCFLDRTLRFENVKRFDKIYTPIYLEPIRLYGFKEWKLISQFQKGRPIKIRFKMAAIKLNLYRIHIIRLWWLQFFISLNNTPMMGKLLPLIKKSYFERLRFRSQNLSKQRYHFIAKNIFFDVIASNSILNVTVM